MNSFVIEIEVHCVDDGNSGQNVVHGLFDLMKSGRFLSANCGIRFNEYKPASAFVAIHEMLNILC